MRMTHPNLYRVYMIYALGCVAFGLNFLLLNPTFDPLSIPKWIAGIVALPLGLSSLLVLNLPLNGRARTVARVLMLLSIIAMLFWCGALVKDFFDRNMTSLQLPIAYVIIALFGYPLLLEPDENPLTNKNGVNGGHE